MDLFLVYFMISLYLPHWQWHCNHWATWLDTQYMALGYQKKKEMGEGGGGLRTYFFHKRKFHKIVLHNTLDIQGPKPRLLFWKFHIFFLVTLGNSTLFLINLWKFHMLFLWYSWKFHILKPLCLFFFWNSPLCHHHSLD